jgi:hypothetical protein
VGTEQLNTSYNVVDVTNLKRMVFVLSFWLLIGVLRSRWEQRRAGGAASLFLFPFEEQVNAFVFDLLKAKPVVKVEGGVEFLDVNGDRLARRARFVLQLTE